VKATNDEIISIDHYIAGFADPIKILLNELRSTIQQAAPGASEKISYQMPTFYLNGNLVHFAVCQRHIGFYPSPSAINAFEEPLRSFKTSKGAVQFPLDKPLPLDLIRQIVEFRVRENSDEQSNGCNLVKI
jgi:uncharacterized protein YdhG (YjbR/CyaY superfamily)